MLLQMIYRYIKATWTHLLLYLFELTFWRKSIHINVKIQNNVKSPPENAQCTPLHMSKFKAHGSVSNTPKSVKCIIRPMWSYVDFENVLWKDSRMDVVVTISVVWAMNYPFLSHRV